MCAKRIRAGDWLYPNDDYRSPSSRGDPQMPLDFCHPQAPHRKLRIPEWYVSSLMLDRALDAVVRRVKKLHREHDGAYIPGYHKDGKNNFISRPQPRTPDDPNRQIDTKIFLNLHED